MNERYDSDQDYYESIADDAPQVTRFVCGCGASYMAEVNEFACQACQRVARGDGRDFTPAPPAVLNPHSVLRNRERARKYLATGDFTWPRDAA